MLSCFPCPNCSRSEWTAAKTHQYVRKQEADGTYAGLRRRVLFNIWFAGLQREIELTVVVCNGCGFVCYSPRPDPEDVAAKYKFLAKHEKPGVPQSPSRRTHRLELARANFLARFISAHERFPARRILDVGGGDGRLMRRFLAKGCACFLVDFNSCPIAGVTRLGSTLDEVPPGTCFDAIICSHVVEHVAEPVHFLRQMRSLLSPKGILYVEVPQEIWKGIPIIDDPVTHINFFTADSLRCALLGSSLLPVAVEPRLAPYGDRFKRVVSAVAIAEDDVVAAEPSNGSALTTRLFYPGAWNGMRHRSEEAWLRWILNGPPRPLARLFRRIRRPQ